MSVQPPPDLAQKPAPSSETLLKETEIPPVDEFCVAQPTPLGETCSPAKPIAPPSETPGVLHKKHLREDLRAPPYRQSVVTWISHGVVLASYPKGQLDHDVRELFAISCTLTGMMLFVLGALPSLPMPDRPPRHTPPTPS